jgi:hypothetical protein
VISVNEGVYCHVNSQLAHLGLGILAYMDQTFPEDVVFKYLPITLLEVLLVTSMKGSECIKPPINLVANPTASAEKKPTLKERFHHNGNRHE